MESPDQNKISARIFFFYLSLFLLTIFLVELISGVKSYGSSLNTFLFDQAKHYASISDFERSFTYINFITKLNISLNLEKRKGELPLSNYRFKLDKASMSPEFLSNYKAYVSGLDTKKIIRAGEGGKSEFFYKLGLIAHMSNQEKLVPVFFETAVYLLPVLSYYHVELANYYLSQDNDSAATNAIELCLKFRFSSEHCKEYKESSLVNEEIEPVGFLKETIIEFFDSQRQ